MMRRVNIQNKSLLINRIKEIGLTNYRIFANTVIKFPREENKNIYLIHGGGGTGKTTIIDAVSWCLFGNEVSHHQECGLPLCNHKSLSGIKEGQNIETVVKVVVETRDGYREITRKSITGIKNGKTYRNDDGYVLWKEHGFWVNFGLRKTVDMNFPIILDSSASRLDLPLKNKFTQDLTESLKNTQIILLECMGELGSQLKSSIAATYCITYNAGLESSSID